jgi:asparagine synthase (glutamine-hydrolysing)
MADALVHRGPDDEGFFATNGFAIGFRRLSVLDIGGSHQPIGGEDGTVQIVGNGEIYNYSALRSELLTLGHEFRTNGDIEVALHAYEQWGMSFLRRLRGMFAMAILDTKNGLLHIARDRVGIKPVFYYHSGNRLLFGSEIKAILASGLAPREVDWDAIDSYLSLLYVPAPNTAFAGIRKLPPASVLTFDGRVARLNKYWEPRRETAVGMNIEEASERLHAILLDAVRLHMQSDVPVGFFLSGGMDSSAMVALAAEAGVAHPITFSAGFHEKSHNELEYARTVASRFSCDHHEMMVRPDAADVLPQIAQAFDEPFGDASAVPTYYISRFAAGHVKVAIGGDGGDELFAGYEWTRRQRFVEQWNRLPPPLRRIAGAITRNITHSSSAAGKFARFIADAASNPLDGYLRRISCFTAEHKAGVYGQRLMQSLTSSTVRALMAGSFATSDTDPVKGMNAADFDFYLPDDDLCKVDRMTMLHSIEGRVPLLDHEVVEFALSLPLEMKLKGLTSKFILKKCMEKTLPPEVMRQRKHGFAIPVSRWTRNELHGDIRRILLSGAERRADVYNRNGLSLMLDIHRSGRQDHGSRLWALLVLELWFRMYVDAPGCGGDRGLRLSDF